MDAVFDPATDQPYSQCVRTIRSFPLMLFSGFHRGLASPLLCGRSVSRVGRTVLALRLPFPFEALLPVLGCRGKLRDNRRCTCTYL